MPCSYAPVGLISLAWPKVRATTVEGVVSWASAGALPATTAKAVARRTSNPTGLQASLPVPSPKRTFNLSFRFQRSNSTILTTRIAILLPFHTAFRPFSNGMAMLPQGAEYLAAMVSFARSKRAVNAFGLAAGLALMPSQTAATTPIVERPRSGSMPRHFATEKQPHDLAPRPAARSHCHASPIWRRRPAMTAPPEASRRAIRPPATVSGRP